MKSFFARPMACLLLLVFTAASASAQPPPSKAEQDQLFHTIESLDAQLFTAYNTCDMPKFDSLIAEDVEFYHDQGGITLGRKDLSDAISKNVCHKVHRELVKGTLEVYPMKDNGKLYGAVEIGVHRFTNPNTPQDVGGEAKFVHLWLYKNGAWKVSRVISYDHHSLSK